MKISRGMVQDVLVIGGCAIAAAGLYIWEPAVGVAFIGMLLAWVGVSLGRT